MKFLGVIVDFLIWGVKKVLIAISIDYSTEMVDASSITTIMSAIDLVIVKCTDYVDLFLCRGLCSL